MTIVKPMRLGLLNRAQREPPKVYFFVTALGYFDLLDPSDFDLETKMWPMTAAALGSTPLDVGMPKPQGEVVVIGDAAAPGGQPVTQMAVEFSVGSVRKRLTVFGDRHWELFNDGAVFTKPLPFERMPLVWERAFGGPDFAANPAGTGDAAQAALSEGRVVRLPNIEDAANLILDVGHAPDPVGVAPMDVMVPARQRYAGTYDDAWLKNHYPGHAVDFDWAFYNTVPSDQWTTGFFVGDERIRIAGMHPDHPVIESRLPGMRVRSFLNHERDGQRTLTETEMRCETVVLFPGQLKGVVIYRGGCEIADIDGKDVADILLAYERLEEPRRSVEHYAKTLRARTDPETAALSFFDEKPLRPDIPEADLADRAAERETLATEREDKWDKRVEAMIAQAYKAAGALPPLPGSIPKPRLPVALPTITPGDIERMDVDMVGLSKALNNLKAYGDQQIANAKQQAATLLSETAGVVAGPGGSLVDAASAAKIRLAAAKFPTPADGSPSMLPSDMPTLDALRQEIAPADASEPADDPFADIVAALQAVRAVEGPLSDDEKAALRARAEGRPEGRMTAPMLDQINGLDLTAGGQVEPPQRPSDASDPEGVDAFLQQLGLGGPASEAMAAVGTKIDALGPQSGMIKPLMDAQPSSTVMDEKAALAQVQDSIADAAVKLEEGFLVGRRMSPVPLAPLEPLRLEASTYLGQMIRECLVAGGDLTSRDWAGAVLAGVDFSGRDLRGAQFERADLTNADFRGANLEDAVFTGANLTGATFSDCAMRGANLSKVSAKGARFNRSDLTDARLIEADLVEADLSATTVENSIALNANLTRANLADARFTKVILMTATIDEAILDRAEFHRCIFLQASMERLSARGTVFARSALVACKQRDGDYTGANFSDTGSVGGAVYDGSVMRDLVALRSGWNAASMIGVDLHAAQLDKSDLGKVDLTDARLTRASLRGAVLVETILVGADAGAATFAEAILRRVDMREASLRHANLYRANIDETNLTYCDLTGVNSLGTNLMRAANVPG
ncbi:DUF2169 domain-containing protein [Thalassobaculum sp.]|uniref:DUF2169 family type VI secretion system accessory protein n=1 Tax=Thalassobaculum sp. TaxID=2022740 RepID=UPI0032EC534B